MSITVNGKKYKSYIDYVESTKRRFTSSILGLNDQCRNTLNSIFDGMSDDGKFNLDPDNVWVNHIHVLTLEEVCEELGCDVSDMNTPTFRKDVVNLINNRYGIFAGYDGDFVYITI